jgi:hypothetical protein
MTVNSHPEFWEQLSSFQGITITMKWDGSGPESRAALGPPKPHMATVGADIVLAEMAIPAGTPGTLATWDPRHWAACFRPLGSGINESASLSSRTEFARVPSAILPPQRSCSTQTLFSRLLTDCSLLCGRNGIHCEAGEVSGQQFSKARQLSMERSLMIHPTALHFFPRAAVSAPLLLCLPLSSRCTFRCSRNGPLRRRLCTAWGLRKGNVMSEPPMLPCGDPVWFFCREPILQGFILRRSNRGLYNRCPSRCVGKSI